MPIASLSSLSNGHLFAVVMPLRKLPAEVRSLLQSSAYISSYGRAVEELVYNSLDSKSTSIAVRINFHDNLIKVIDNGSGVTRVDMDRIATKHMTSRCSDISDINSPSNLYGFRGIALASLVDVSAGLKLTSRHSEGERTWCKVYRNGKMENVFETVSRPSHGTTVEIEGFLYNLELQRKILNSVKELQEIKVFLEHTALLHHGVSFSLRDDVKRVVALKIPKNKDIFQALTSIYGLDITKLVQELQIEKCLYKIKAYIGKKCMNDNSFQLIYLNGRHVINSKLHAFMNCCLSKIFSAGNDKLLSKKHANCFDGDEISKSFNPFYILFISCPYNAYNMSQLTNKTLVEFHNWISINGIFKTLAKVFADSLEPKITDLQSTSEVEADYNDSKPKTAVKYAPKTKELQDKVASIVDKILKSNPRKLHAQNEVKGKPAKRHNKKKYPEIPKYRNLMSKKNKDKIAEKEIVNSVSSKPLAYDQTDATKKIDKDTKTEPPVKNVPKIRKAKYDKTKLLHQHGDTFICKPKYIKKEPKQNLIRHKKNITAFELTNGSVKQRCSKLAQNMFHLMHRYVKSNKLASRHMTIQKTVKSSNVYNGRKHESIHKRTGQIIIREVLQFPTACDRKKFIEKHLKKCQGQEPEIKTRYDLVKTIIQSKTAKSKKNTLKDKQFAEGHQNVTHPESLSVLTYQSHNYNENIVSTKHIQKYSYIKDKTGSNLNKVSHFESAPSFVVRNKIKHIEKNPPVKRARISNKSLIQAEIHNYSERNIYEQTFNEINTNSVNSPNTNSKEIHGENLYEIYNSDEEVQSPEYNFDNELNRTIPLTLTNQPAKDVSHQATAHSDIENSNKNKLSERNTNKHTHVKIINKMHVPSKKRLGKVYGVNVYKENNIDEAETQSPEYNFKQNLKRQMSLVNLKAKENIENKPSENEAALTFHNTYTVEQPIFSPDRNNVAVQNIYSPRCSSKYEHEVVENLQTSVSHVSNTLARTNNVINRFNLGFNINNCEEDNKINVVKNSILDIGPENFQDLVDKDYEITFVSNPRPQNSEEIIGITPIDVCRAVIESSDLFDETMHFTQSENSGNINVFQNNIDSIKAMPDITDKGIVAEKSNIQINECENMDAQNTISEDLFDNDNTDENILKRQINAAQLIENISGGSDNLIQKVICNNSSLNNALDNQKSNNNCKNKVFLEALNEINGLKMSNASAADTSLMLGKGNNTNIAVITNLVESTDVNGTKYYLHSKTGMTHHTFIAENDRNFNLKRRPNHIPKGLSPIMKNGRDNNITVFLSQEYFRKSMYENFLNDLEKCSEVYEATVQNVAELLANKDSVTNKYRKMNASIVFDGTSINTAVVLKQIDNKFIAAMLEGKKYDRNTATKYLVLFDQHAVHERIRLETLLHEYKAGNAWKSLPCKEFSLSIGEEDLFYMQNYKNQFTQIGLAWNACPGKDNSELLITAIPVGMLGKNLRKMEVIIPAVKALIHEEVNMLKCMSGAANNNPKVLMDLVNMEACRYAIKFGDHLRQDACCRLIRDLVKCKTPFQCAHGRPVLAVLFAVKVESRSYKINTDAIKAFNC